MNFSEDLQYILYDVQKLCHDLSNKIDSVIHMLEIFSMYNQYSNMMWDFRPDISPPDKQERSETMNPQDFQKIMNKVKQSDQSMSQDEFNQIFEAMKQGKSAEEVARMEQMVQMAKSFLK